MAEQQRLYPCRIQRFWSRSLALFVLPSDFPFGPPLFSNLFLPVLPLALAFQLSFELSFPSGDVQGRCSVIAQLNDPCLSSTSKDFLTRVRIALQISGYFALPFSL